MQYATLPYRCEQARPTIVLPIRPNPREQPVRCGCCVVACFVPIALVVLLMALCFGRQKCSAIAIILLIIGLSISSLVAAVGWARLLTHVLFRILARRQWDRVERAQTALKAIHTGDYNPALRCGLDVNTYYALSCIVDDVERTAVWGRLLANTIAEALRALSHSPSSPSCALCPSCSCSTFKRNRHRSLSYNNNDLNTINTINHSHSNSNSDNNSKSKNDRYDGNDASYVIVRVAEKGEKHDVAAQIAGLIAGYLEDCVPLRPPCCQILMESEVRV